MDPLTTAAASGLRARMEALDMLANNIANASTSGYKRDGEFYSIYQDAEAQMTDPDNNMLPLVEKPWTDVSQGTLQLTGNQTDFALQGRGYFAVNGPSGTLYTRNGNFRVSATGVLTTGEGYSVRLAGGTTAQLRAGVPLEVSSDGTLTQAGLVLGKLDVIEFPEGGLSKQGSTLFRQVDPAKGGTAATEAEVHQGKLEGANVNTAESAVRLVNLMRQFEGLQRAITIGADMNRKAIEEVARVGS